MTSIRNTNSTLDKDVSSPLWSTAGTLYQVLSDEERTLKFKHAIISTIRGGNVVVDIGTGSGILALFAAQAGASRVYAIESDPSNCKATEAVLRDNDHTGTIRLIESDALCATLPEKADIVICELMSTALLDEPQIRLMNRAVRDFLKEGGMVIPKKAITYGELVTADFSAYGFELRVPQYEWSWIKSRCYRLSNPVRLLETDFSAINDEHIRCSGTVRITMDGKLNGLRLFTRTFVTDDVIHESSMGFCPPVVVPTRENLNVQTGDEVDYALTYKAGYGYAGLRLEIFKR